LALIPTLRKTTPFPSTISYTFLFDVYGVSTQIVYNELEITLSSDTGTPIYLERIQEFRYQHTLPLNTLINGNQYVAKIRIYDINQVLLGESAPLFFYCFSYPTLAIPTIVNGEVNNQTVTFEGTYVQTEGELLQSYIFYLYNSSQYLIAQSPEIYSETISYEFSELENSETYFIELKIVTDNEMEFSTGLIEFIARYIAPRFASVIELENSPSDASVFVKCNVIRIIGVANVEPTYITDEFIDLTNNIVEFNQGFSVTGDFDLRLWLKDIVENESFFTYESISGAKLELKLIQNMVYLYVFLNETYILQKLISEELVGIADNILFIDVKHASNLYDLYCEVLI